MKLFYVVQEAIQALRSNLLRSLLTIIGIVVGIFSVTMMLALGTGLQNNILNRFNSFVSGDITIGGALTVADYDWVTSQRYVKAALATASIQKASVSAFGESFSPTVKLAIGDYHTVANLTMVSGVAYDFSSTTFADKVAIVDEGFVKTVTDKTNKNVASTTISIGGQQYTIVGVMKGGTADFGRRGDGTVLVPYRSAVGLLTNTTDFSAIAISLRNQAYYEVAAKYSLEALNASRGAAIDSTDYFSVTSAQTAIQTAQETTSMLTLFLALIGGIALFVGGIGTMNMMLTTVTERTKEIGLRKAIGARDRDILLQILAESVMLTVIGGAVGIALTYGATLLADHFLAADSVISLQLSTTVVVVATAVSFFVGIIFGVYPARNASKLQPVDALRAD